MPASPAAALSLIREHDLAMVDLRFVDLFGQWQHFTVPAAQFDEDAFSEGLGFDGSSIRGFQRIHESDMVLVPDPATAAVDPIYQVPTLALICDVRDPATGGPYSRDARFVARKAEAFLRQSGLADVSYWGPELEFYIFSDARFDQTPQGGFFHLDAPEAPWNSGRGGAPNLAYTMRHKEGYFPVPPADKLQDLRSRIALALGSVGVPVEVHHHEVGPSGQGEIDIRYSHLTRMADMVMWTKFVVKNVALREGFTATFMPKPVFGENGSGMHVHQSLWRGGTNLFFDAGGYAATSELARYYIGGLLRHAAALLALVAPTTNSYRRLVPGYEAPVNLVYSQRNRSACVRIPVYNTNPKAKRVEFRPPDASGNPYLTMAALLMAGLDGIANRIEPAAPIDRDLYELSPEEAAQVPSTPGSLAESLDALERDHDFLLRGDVFTPDLLETWIAYKREQELAAVNLRPHPYEFVLYFDA